jgi:hypothetical protein
MDAQTIPSGNGYNETLSIWNFDTYVDDADKFMEKYIHSGYMFITDSHKKSYF